MNFGIVFLSYIVLASVGKLALILYWTKRLHDLHGDKASFGVIFRWMFGPQSAATVGEDVWRDLKSIQWWNGFSNTVATIVAFCLVIWFVATR
jgi:hypothetical protein